MRAHLRRLGHLLGRRQVLLAVFLVFLALVVLVDNRDYRNFYYLAVLPVLIAYLTRNGAPAIPRTPLVAAVLGLLAWGTVATLWGGKDPAALVLIEHLRRGVLIGTFGLCLTLLARQVSRLPSHIALTLAGAAAVSGTLAAYGLYAEGSLGARLPPALSTPDVIDGATMIAVPAAALPALALDARRPLVLRIPAALIYPVLIAVILLSQSRGALLAALAALGVAVLGLRRPFVLPLAAMGAAVVVGLILAPFDAVSFVTRADSYRLEIWQQAIAYWQQRPVFGHGVEHGMVFGRFEDMTIIDAHNMFLDALVTGGVIGAGLLAAVFALAAAEAVRALRAEGDAVLLTLVTFSFVSALFHFGKYMMNASAEWIFLWLPVSLAIGYQARRRAAWTEVASTAQPGGRCGAVGQA